MTVTANDSGSPYGAEIVLPTFAHSLATYLTRNGRNGDTTRLQVEIENFMYVYECGKLAGHNLSK